MKKTFFNLAFLFSLVAFVSCGSKKETAASIAEKWCDLNAKAYKAEGAAKEAAEQAKEKFEKEIESKYKNNKAFMEEMEREVEKCEAASEGR